jgi:simple sugar transport system permease protein
MNWEVLLGPSVLEASLRIATPLLLAALGGAFTHHAGIFNIALEGMMLFGAFFAIVASYYTSNWLIAIAVTILVGLIIGLLYGVFTIHLKADFIVTGIAINVLGLGLTTYLLRALFHVKAGLQDARIAPLPDINIPLLNSLGSINEIFNNQSLFTYVGWILVVVLWFIFYRTPFGLHLRAAGEHPDALETAGISLTRTRYIAALCCGVLCALAGAHLSLGYLNQYVINVTSGRGFISMAAVLFGSGNPVIIILVSLLFGFAESISIRFQGIGVPGYFALMIPYVVTILALVAWSIQKQQKLQQAEAAPESQT